MNRSIDGRRKSLRETQYESPLNSFTESSERFERVRNLVSVKNEERRLTRGMLQKLQNKQNALCAKESLQNSVIVISDSDNETGGNKEDASCSIIECSPFNKLSSSLRRKSKKKEEPTNSSRQNKRRSSRTPAKLSATQSSSSSNTQSSFNGENIAPTQREDDVVELWANLNPKPRKRKKKRLRQDDETSKKMNFVIDTKPSMKYLRYLATDEEPARKKRKLCHNVDKPTLCKRRKKREYVNANSYLTQPKAALSHEENVNTTVVSEESNSLSPRPSTNHLREIVVDGCNVAMAHTNHQMFSEKGIQLVVDYFIARGHVVKVFLPQHVRSSKYSLIEQLYKKGIVIFTPSRKLDGKFITSYDDRFILKYATECRGIVISSDQYRDLYLEKPEWQNTIRERLLMPTFVGDYIMFPDDPLGKFGPNLETFLKH